MDLIDRRVAIDALCDNCNNVQAVCPHYPCKQYTAINALPPAQPDRGCIDQIRWERDMAIQQLKELGYGLGEKPRTDCDTISRQAAIDAISCDITVTGRQNAELVAATIGTFADRIKALPSAEPEIILCKDCIDYQTDWIPESIPDRHYCATMDSMMPEDAYCSYAERRTDG